MSKKDEKSKNWLREWIWFVLSLALLLVDISLEILFGRPISTPDINLSYGFPFAILSVFISAIAVVNDLHEKQASFRTIAFMAIFVISIVTIVL